MMGIEFDGITFYTTKEVAGKLNVSTETVRTYIKRSELKAKRIGNSFLVSEISLKQFLDLPTDATVAST